MHKSTNSRRTFLKQAGVLTAGTVLVGQAVPKVHAAENNTIKIAVVGCGSRGSSATQQALSADPNVKLWAVADTFKDRAERAAGIFKDDHPEKNEVSPDRCFVGFEAYKNAMDSLDKGDVVLLTTPPAFRPLHFAYAVEKGLNVFAEKPLAVDVPGLKWLMESNAKAKTQNLKVGVGLNNRHYFRTAETVKAIQDGKLGDITSMWVYRMHSTHPIGPMGDRTPLEQQLRHIFNFNWTTGGFIVDALIHNLDIVCWAKQDLPVAAQGQGGREVRREKDQMIDHAAVEYIFGDGTKMVMQAKTIPNCWTVFQANIQGTKGAAVLGEGVRYPRIWSDWAEKNQIWAASQPENDSYQTEHDLFFKAIRENQEWNELKRGIDATFTPILGRMAVDTGKYLKAEDAWTSTFQYVPDIANMSFDKPAPVLPDENGNYPQPIPGVTQI